MKTKGQVYGIILPILILVGVILLPPQSRAATMNDYCITPSFLSQYLTPNFLLMIDNSASMFDLAYSDKGKKNSAGNFTREPYYCYDQSYQSTGTYTGYFEKDKYYEYNFTNGYFAETSSLPASCSKRVAGALCIDLSTATPPDVTRFVAKGNYLNWLTASKFDVEKQVLTGGKHVSEGGVNFLKPESRGCVGQSFVKEALTADFVNYDSPETNNPNTSLGITFGVRGPYPNAVNKAAPSPGGQTYFDIFYGDYDQGKCQDAVTAITSGGNADIKMAVEACLAFSGTGTQTAVTKTKVSFQQSMQACWQYRHGFDISIDDINTVKTQCTDIWSSYATCSNNPDKVCTADADCGAGDTCVFGPAAIVAGNPALLCSSEYEGQYYQLSAATGTCVKKNAPNGGACASDADCGGGGYRCSGAFGVGWVLKAGVTEAQLIQTHRNFCNSLTTPNVTDPTDAPSDTSTYDNVPAILSGMGVEAQLNQPIKTLTVRLQKTTPPSGLLQEFDGKLRFGMMSFNYNGSATECGTAQIPCPKVCSNNTSLTCVADLDCPVGGTCTATVNGTSNLDGAKIINHIGRGHCSASTTTVCATDAHCPTDETCISDGVGNHTSGLIHDLDGLGAASWTPFAEAFYNAIGYFARTSTGKSRTDLRLNSGDFNENLNPITYYCQKNFVLIVSDGMSTADQNPSVSALASLYTAAGGETGNCPNYAGSKNLDNLAWIARNRKIGSFSTSTASTDKPTKTSEYIRTYVVFNGDSNGQSGECNSETLMSQTAANGNGLYLKASSDPTVPEQGLYAKLRRAFEDASGSGASGTAASILSNSEGSGANILQAVFYPLKTFDKDASNEPTEAKWIGEMQNLWYYIDPQIGNSSVREDTGYTTGAHELNLTNDYVTRFFFDSVPTSPTYGNTMVKRYQDTDGNGTGDLYIDTISPDAVASLWRAGKQLWSKTPSSRLIKTNTGSGSLVSFASLDTSLASTQQLLQASSQTEADNIISYTRGIDFAGYCSVTTGTSCSQKNDCPEGETCIFTTRRRTVQIGADSHVWKLGDIISSTPRLQSSVRQNAYNLLPPQGYNDKSYGDDNTNKGYIYTQAYRDRGMVYVGANDGMLHAFKLGTLTVTPEGAKKATLSGTNLGEEQWAFIPKNVLPYLKYLYDPYYAHLYYVDGATTVVDASIGTDGCSESNYWNCPKDFASGTGNNWRTILIGGMGIGGAAKNATSSCTADLNGDGVIDDKDCVKTPLSGVGYSSYFALDVTDPANPTLLWEFSHPDLGFATTGPATVKISAKDAGGRPDNTKNGRWFAVFASGPTGPIDTTNHQFIGKSDQSLKLFVLDLKDGTLVRTIDASSLGLSNAFAASLINSTTDTERWNKSLPGHYQDEVLYFGYTKANANTITSTTKWTQGGVLRLVTYEDPIDVNSWKLSKLFDGIGPVTTSIARLQDRKGHNFWLYFGTGRYFFSQDDNSSSRRLYAVKEPCYDSGADKLNQACTESQGALGPSDLTDQTSASNASVSNGWYIGLDGVDTANSLGAERVITDPVAMTNGAVFYTTFKPTSDICQFGGNSYLWGVKFDTGLQAPEKALEAKALVQVSTGSFEEIDLKTALTAKNNRRTADPMPGKPPGDPPPIVSKSNLKPVKRIIHIQER